MVNALTWGFVHDQLSGRNVAAKGGTTSRGRVRYRAFTRSPTLSDRKSGPDRAQVGSGPAATAVTRRHTIANRRISVYQCLSGVVGSVSGMASGPYDDKAEIRGRLDLTHAQWQRAPGSNPDEPLVEYAFVSHPDGVPYVVLRDAASPDGPYQVFTRTEWEAFLGGIRDGDFDQYY